MRAQITASDPGVTLYEVGPFVLDLARRLLLRDGAIVPLAPKAFELLVALAARPGRVVSKREILETVWPDTHVEDSNITQNVSLLRKALSAAGQERLIVTVPRAGYQLAAPVVASRTASVRRRAAVFPLVALSEGPRGYAIGALLAEAVIESLSRASITAYRLPAPPAGDDATSTERTRAVNADVYVTGYFRVRATAWHVILQFFDAESRSLLSFVRVAGDFTALGDVREAIAERVSEVAAVLGDTPSQRTELGDRRPSEAFRLYLLGRHCWNKRTAAALGEALGYAKRILEVDPTFVKGYIGVADTYNLLAVQHITFAPRETFPRALAAAARALEIDHACGEAYASIAFAEWWYEWRSDAGEQSFCKAMELAPLYATSYHWYAEALASAGRFSESLSYYDMAIALDPLSSAIRTDYAAALSLAGQSDECERVLSETLRFDPDFVRAHLTLASNRARNGALKSARQSLKGALQREPNAPNLISLSGHIAARAGRRSEARAALRRLGQLAARKPAGTVARASLLADVGEFRDAGNALARAFAARDTQVLWIAVDSRFDALRRRTDFAGLWKRHQQTGGVPKPGRRV